jgi:hypothetical protein
VSAAGSVQTLFEKDSTGASTTVTTVPGKATMAMMAMPLQYVVPDKSWSAGAGGDGCLAGANDTEFSRENIGGTQIVQFAVDPGSKDVSLYPSDPGTCDGEAEIGPVTVDATDGSSTLVVAYGVADDLELIALPIDS